MVALTVSSCGDDDTGQDALPTDEPAGTVASSTAETSAVTETTAPPSTGPEDGIPVLFVGGTGTSATVVRLVEFLSSAREELGIRLISIDRNGFGSAPLDPEGDYDDFATTALGVLDELGVDEFSLVGISGDGVRTFRAKDGTGDPEGLAHEFELFCTPTQTDVSAVTAPVSLYYGDQDTTVPFAYADQWAQRYLTPAISVLVRILVARATNIRT